MALKYINAKSFLKHHPAVRQYSKEKDVIEAELELS
jgi:hypothetical protein